MSNLLTVNPDALAVLSATPADLRAVVFSPGGALQQLPLDLLLARLIATDQIFADKAQIDADLAHPADTVGLVINDPTASQNGWYRKVGASGAGSWSQFEELAKSARMAAAASALQAGEGASRALAAAASVSGALDALRSGRLTEKVKSAVSDPSNIKLLVTKDGAKTFRSGTTNEIETLTPLIGPASVNLVNPSPLWNGTAGPTQPRNPQLTDHGISMHSQTGFNFADGLLTAVGNVSIDMVLSFPALAATYATKAAADAALGSHAINDIIQVTGDTNTTFTPDPADEYMASGAYSDANLVNGYYYKNWQGTWEGFGGRNILALTNSANVNGEYLRLLIDKRGFVQFSGFDGALGANLRSTAYNLFEAGQSAPQHVKVEADDGVLRLWVNGAEIFAFEGTLDMTALNTLYVNGSSRAANATLPVNGNIFTLHALGVSQNLTFHERRLVSDAIAEAMGTPRQRWNPVAKAVVVIGQSNGAGSRISGEPDTATGWDGNVDSEAVGRSPSISFRSQQEFIPGMYGTRGAANGGAFGPCQFDTNAFGNIARGWSGVGSAPETIEWGFFKQLFNEVPEAQDHDWYMIGDARGGASLALLQTKSGQDIWSVKSQMAALQAANPRDAINALWARLIEHCAKRGQQVELVLVYQDQGETLAGLGLGYGAAYEADARQWISEELLALNNQNRMPWFFLKEIAYSSDRNNDSRNTSPNYYAEQRRSLEANRDKDFRIIYLGGLHGLYGNWIHKGVRLRVLGEYMGRIFANIEYKAARLDFGQLKVTSTSINGSNQIEVQFNQSITTATKFPDVFATLNTGGVDTYGFVFEPHASSASRSISAVSVSGNRATITVNGVGAIAGDAILIGGTGAPYNNIKAATAVTGLYRDVDFTTPFGGAGANSPLISEGGPLADLTPWAPSGRWVL